MTINSSDRSTAPRPAHSWVPTPEGADSDAPALRPVPAPVGGTWDAGYELGRLDAQLAARPVRVKVGLTIRAVNRVAAGVLARRHGYELHVRATAEEGFVWVEFWPRR